jgi:hypothetical protein
MLAPARFPRFYESESVFQRPESFPVQSKRVPKILEIPQRLLFQNPSQIQ